MYVCIQNTTRMRTLLHTPLRSGRTTSVGKAGGITVPLSNGVMRNILRGFKSRFLLGPRVPSSVSFWGPGSRLCPRPSDEKCTVE